MASRSTLLAAFAATALSGGLLALAPPATGGSKPDPLRDLVRRDDALALRLSGRTRISSDGWIAGLTIRRLTDGTQVDGTFVRGRPLTDRSGGRVRVIPWLIEDELQSQGASAAEAAASVDQLLSGRRTTRLGKLLRFDRAVRDRLPLGAYGGVLVGEGVAAPIPPPVDGGSALAATRRRIAGDDTLWAAALAGDASAYAQLRSDPEFGGLRFTDASDGQRRMAHFRHSTLVLKRARRDVTLLPMVPAESSLTGWLVDESQYEIAVAGRRRVLSARVASSGKRIQGARGRLRFRTPTADERFLLHSGALTRPRPITVTPPNGDYLVHPRMDWESPQDPTTYAGGENEFVVRLRFPEPLDPATVTDREVSLTATRVHVGTEDEAVVAAYVPGHVTLTQSVRDGAIVELRPNEPLQPKTEYEVRVRGSVTTLGNQYAGSDWLSRFTVAGSAPAQELTQTFEGSPPADYLGTVPTPTALWPRPETFPDGSQRLAPDPSLTTSVAHTAWLDTGRLAARLSHVLDDPDTPGMEGSEIDVPANGSTVTIEVRTAPRHPVDPSLPQPLLATSWQPIDDIAVLDDRAFAQVRVTFTLPPDLPPGAALPSVERIVIGVAAE